MYQIEILHISLLHSISHYFIINFNVYFVYGLNDGHKNANAYSPDCIFGYVSILNIFLELSILIMYEFTLLLLGTVNRRWGETS